MNDENILETYNIPAEILEKIPPYFWPALAGEIYSVFGYDAYREDSDGERPIYYLSNTCGWSAAFEATCKKLGMGWLLEYEYGLDWWQSDLFAGEIDELTVENMSTKNPGSYYLYLIGRDT